MTTELLVEKTTVSSMNIDQFLAELQLLALSMNWKLQIPYYYKNLKMEGVANIRGMLDDMSYCPITAMAMCKTGRIFSMNQWDCARIHLGLSHEDALVIAEAADSPCSHSTELLDLHNRMRCALGI